MKIEYRRILGGIQLQWNEVKDTYKYRVFGMTQNFAWENQGETDVPYMSFLKEDIEKYLKFKIHALNYAGEILEESDEIKVEYKQLEEFSITEVDSYRGKTLVFNTQGIYDLYRVYDTDRMIFETEDFIVELKDFTASVDLKNIVVEGYNFVDGEYQLAGMSNGQIIKKDRQCKAENTILTVVVPLYNSELFMCRTIDSILASSMDSLNIILIDDASKDNTKDIAKWYAKKYGCIKAVIHSQNEGVAVRRNEGLDNAKGGYIAFCDNDDIVHPYMYEKLWNACRFHGTKIAIAQALIRKDVKDKEYYLTMEGSDTIETKYSFDDMFHNRGVKGKNMFRVAVWNKIVQTDLARKARFPTGYTGPGVLYEDVAYTSSLYSYADDFVHVKDAYYVRDKRKQKTVGTASTWHQKEDNEYVWKIFIYGFSYALYNRGQAHRELSDYTHFKRLIQAYDKFNTPSELRDYRDEKLTELIQKQELYKNKLIMDDEHLAEVVDSLVDYDEE